MIETLVPPATEALTLDAVRAHLRLDGTDEDGLLQALIPAARQACESSLSKRLITQTIRMTLDQPYPITRLSVGPVQSVRRIDYIGLDGQLTQMPASAWRLSGDRLAPMDEWPMIGAPIGGFRIEYVTGFGDSPDDIPAPIRLGMLMLIAHWYENREATVVTQSLQAVNLPLGVAALWAPFRRMRV